MTKPLENSFGIIFRGVRCLHISPCNQHNFMMFISKCSSLQNDHNETGFKSRNSHIYIIYFQFPIYVNDWNSIKNVIHIKILLYRLSIYLRLQINYRRDHLVTQNLFRWNPYDNKCTCRPLNHKVMLITSRDIAVSTFWWPSWTPSWILENAPAGITGSFSMLFLMVFGRYPEKFSMGIFFSPSACLLVSYYSPSMRDYRIHILFL